MKAKFKLSQLAAVDTVQKELIHPKHGETGIFVTLAGPTHPTWKAALEEYNASEEEQNIRGLKLFAGSILGWDEEAIELPYTTENVLALFKDDKHEWMARQLTDAVLDNTTFFQ